MIELSVLALLLRIANLGYEPVIVTRVMTAGAGALRAFICDPRNYDGAARVRPSSCEHVVVVRTAFGPRRMVRYTWILSPGRGTTEVDLAVQVESRGVAVRVALLLGGRRWLQRRLEAMLATLAAQTAAGSAPICRSMPSASQTAQVSAILPPAMRSIDSASTAIVAPVGAIPLISPTCVPRPIQRLKTRSPAE
jgi:hypothetical protein